MSELPYDWIAWVPELALLILAIGLLLGALRLVTGPSLADRVIALDMLAMIAVSIIAVLTLRTSHTVLLDVGLGIAVIGFVATLALAGFIERNAKRGR